MDKLSNDELKQLRVEALQSAFNFEYGRRGTPKTMLDALGSLTEVVTVYAARVDSEITADRAAAGRA